MEKSLDFLIANPRFETMLKFRLQTIKNFHSKTDLPSSRVIMLICQLNILWVQVPLLFFVSRLISLQFLQC